MKPEAGTRQPRILIVEDETVVAMDIARRLTCLGYAVAGSVATGAGAIALAQETQPDLVLLDIRLRGPMTGIEAAEQIRQRFRHPVVFLTSHAEADTLHRASQADPFGYILKPFGDQELRIAIEMALYKQQTEDNLRWDAAVTAALSALYVPLISPSASLEMMAQEVLDRAQTLTGSGHGFVSIIDPVTGESEALTLTGMMKDGSCLVQGESRRIVFLREADGRYRGLWGEALNTRQAFFSNSPATHPATVGVPSGHLPLQQLLSVPVLLGPQLVGLIALANPGRDYTERDLQAVQRLAEFYALGIQRQRVEESLEKARDAAETANRLKSEFLANMSHEIRTPMAVILGYTELLAGSDLREPEQQEFLQKIQGNGESLLRLISDILDLARIEAGRLPLERTEYTLQHVIDDVLAVMQLRAAEKGLRLQVVRVFPLLETLYTDPVRLRQILVNLLSNAVKFTHRGELSLTIQSFSETRRMQFAVTDTGIGMSATTIAQLFQPFTQGDGTHTRPYGGTGLGLAISQRLAKALGGQIEVQSEIGRGSTFTLTIDMGAPPAALPDPLQSPRPLTVSAARDATSVQSSVLQNRVLLMEDEPSLRLIIGHTLSKWNLELDTANDGRSGCEMAEKSRAKGCPYDLILMDIRMPTMNGFEATQWLREHGWRGPIVAMTAYAMTGDRERCLNAGCDDYIANLIITAQLREILSRYLDGVTRA